MAEKARRVWKTDAERIADVLPGGFRRSDRIYEESEPEDLCSRCGLPTVAYSEPKPARFAVGPFELGGRVMKLLYCAGCQLEARRG